MVIRFFLNASKKKSCNLYVRNTAQKFEFRSLNERCNLQNSSVDRRTVLKCISTETGCEGTYWINLVHEGDQWHVLINKVTNFRKP
jgi:hypothetical protein